MAEPERMVVDVDLLADEIRAISQPFQLTLPENEMNIATAVEELEHKLITEALKKFACNRTKAAECLGLSRWGLLNKIECYGLES